MLNDQGYELTPKANFPETDVDAARNMAISNGIVLLLLDGLFSGDDLPEPTRILWEAAVGLNAAAEAYYERRCS